MGKLSVKSQEELFLYKIKKLFDKTLSKLGTSATAEFSFDKFLESFDEGDRFTGRLFEFMIKDMAHKHGRNQRRNASENLAFPTTINDANVEIPASVMLNPLTFDSSASRSQIFSRMADSFLALTRRSSSNADYLLMEGNRSLRQAAEAYVEMHQAETEEEEDDFLG